MTVEAIIFLHYGDADYLPRVMRQARAVNPNTPILFLGDEAAIRRVGTNAECHEIAKYSGGAEGFLKSYIHMSRHSANFTRQSIARWFILRDFCRNQGATCFLHADTDVLLFAPVENALSRLSRAFGRFDVALSRASDTHSTSGHASLWLELDRLGEFCAMVERIYNCTDVESFLQLVAVHRLPIDSGIPDAGLVSDMTLLDMFQRHSTARIVDSGAILEGATLDHNINLANQAGQRFLTADGIKQLVWRDGVPHGLLEAGGLVAFDVLHCQGMAKRHISDFTPAIHDDSLVRAIDDTPEVLVRAAYRVLLEREPDLLGLQAWTNQLNVGLSPLRLLQLFIESDEFQNLLICDRGSVQPKHDLVMALETLLKKRHDDHVNDVPGPRAYHIIGRLLRCAAQQIWPPRSEMGS
jgi:hypothetical protein